MHKKKNAHSHITLKIHIILVIFCDREQFTQLFYASCARALCFLFLNCPFCSQNFSVRVPQIFLHKTQVAQNEMLTQILVEEFCATQEFLELEGTLGGHLVQLPCNDPCLPCSSDAQEANSIPPEQNRCHRKRHSLRAFPLILLLLLW